MADPRGSAGPGGATPRGSAADPDGAAVPGAPAPAGRPEPSRSRRRLGLGDPMASEHDRPGSWGEPEETDADRAAWYEAQRPPHHG